MGSNKRKGTFVQVIRPLPPTDIEVVSECYVTNETELKKFLRKNGIKKQPTEISHALTMKATAFGLPTGASNTTYKPPGRQLATAWVQSWITNAINKRAA